MNTFRKCLSELNIVISDDQLDMFDHYYDLLVFWNKKFNLTSITDKEDVFIKHFADSITFLKYIDPAGRCLLDVGTGAGFPGVPLKIMSGSCNVVLLDSLGKRICFLNELIRELGLSDIIAVHSRAEDLARDFSYREQFDIVTSRAVANLSTLSEYCLPFVKCGGIFVSYKGDDIDEEIISSSNSINILGGCINCVKKFSIPYTDYGRSLIIVDKIENTADIYPRKAGVPSKKPL